MWESIFICARGECVPVPIKIKVSSFCPYYIRLIKIKPACLYSLCTLCNWIQAGDDMQTCDTAPSGYRIRSLTLAHSYALSLQKGPKRCRLGAVLLWMLPWDHERCKKKKKSLENKQQLFDCFFPSHLRWHFVLLTCCSLLPVSSALLFLSSLSPQFRPSFHLCFCWASHHNPFYFLIQYVQTASQLVSLLYLCLHNTLPCPCSLPLPTSFLHSGVFLYLPQV